MRSGRISTATDPRPSPACSSPRTAWGLAEFFTRKRRMALPSIILLLLAFTGGVLLTAFATFVLGHRRGDVRE